MNILKMYNTALKIALITLCVLLIAMMPPLIKLAPAYQIYRFSIIARGLMIVAVLVGTIAWAIKSYFYRTELATSKKYKAYFLGIISFVYLTIFCHSMIMLYQVIENQNKITIGFMRGITGEGTLDYENALKEQKMLDAEFEKKKILIWLAYPAIRFCSVQLGII